MPLINRIAKAFEQNVVTQDWHTPGHASFASIDPHRPEAVRNHQAPLRDAGAVARPLRARHGRTRASQDLDIRRRR